MHALIVALLAAGVSAGNRTAGNKTVVPKHSASTVKEISREENSTAMALDTADAKKSGDALAEKIEQKVVAAKEKEAATAKDDDDKPADIEDTFPTDWMNPKNVMKYDIDQDPAGQRIESAANTAEEQRKFNLQHVG